MNVALTECLRRSLERVFRQRKLRHIVDWADTYFELPAVSSNNQDDRRWKTYGYQKFVLHAFADLNTETVAVIKSVQMGLSKCALVGIGYESAHRMRSNCIWLPRRQDRDEFANVQIKAMLEHCSEVGDQLRVPVHKVHPENTTGRRGFKGAQSYCRATQTLQDVSSIPIMTAFVDEFSKTPRMIKDHKDDVGKAPLDGIRGRLASAEAPKLNALSTPTEVGVCQMTELFDGCRVKFHRHYCCPVCGTWQPFEWGGPKTRHGFKWHKQHDDRGEVDNLLTAKTVYYQCGGGTAHNPCSHKFRNHDLKNLDDEAAEWRSMVQDEETGAWAPTGVVFDEVDFVYRDLRTRAEVEAPHSVGIQIRGWMSRRKRWWQTVLQYLEAVDAIREGRPGKMADWVQDCSGEAYAPPQSQTRVRHGHLAKKQEDEGVWEAELPDEVQALTAWWDVQDGYIVGLVVGWGYGEESWVIERITKWGDATTTDVLKSIQDLTQRKFRKRSGFELGVFLSGVDARYRTDHVNAICSGEWKARIIPTYGDRSTNKPVIVGSTKTKKKRDSYGVTVCSNAGKDIIYARYLNETPGPGYIHISQHPSLDESMLKEMVSEQKGLNRNDPMRWICPDNVRNEGLDLMVGNLAIVMLAQQRFRLRFVPSGEYRDDVVNFQEAENPFAQMAQVFGN